jgi:hypothetical protein
VTFGGRQALRDTPDTGRLLHVKNNTIKSMQPEVCIEFALPDSAVKIAPDWGGP